MFPEIKKLLERKIFKDILFVLLYVVFILSLLLLFPQARLNFIRFIVGNKLQNLFFSPYDLSEYLFALGYCTIFLVLTIYWFVFIKRNIFTTLLFIAGVFGIYLAAYLFLTGQFKALDLLRTPLFGLGSLFIFYVIKNRHFLLEKTFYKLKYFQDRSNSKQYAVKHDNEKDEIKTNILIQPQLNEIKKTGIASILNSSLFVFICGCILGALFFIYNFGTLILDFTYTDWLMNGHDLSAGYLGWELSRNSGLSFPIYIVTLVFSVISKYFPDRFQFFGFYTLFSYILQGGCGALVVKKIGGNTLQSLIGSMFFILSTVMLFRVFYHISLANHFIILLCILECLNKKRRNIAGNVIYWGIVYYLAYTSHPYFLVMAFLFMIFRFWIVKDFKIRYLIYIIGIIFIFIPVIYFIVFFLADIPLGQFSPAILLRDAQSNINALFNSQGLSRFLKGLPHARNFQYEGNGYPGLGILLALIFIFIYKIVQRFYKKKIIIDIDNKNKNLFYLLLSGIIILCLSPTITFNQYVLFSYPLPPAYEHLWSIFRSTGRFVWPVVYFIMIFCIWWIIKRFSVKVSTIILAVLLLIQWVDLQPGFEKKGNFTKTKHTWNSELVSPVWEMLGKDYNRIYFTDLINLYFTPKYHSYLDLAVNNKMTVIQNSIIRGNDEAAAIHEKKLNEAEHILIYGPENDTIYIIKSLELLLKLIDSKLNFYVIDNEIIGISSKREYLFEYEEVSEQFISGIRNTYVSEAIKTDENL